MLEGRAPVLSAIMLNVFRTCDRSNEYPNPKVNTSFKPTPLANQELQPTRAKNYARGSRSVRPMVNNNLTPFYLLPAAFAKRHRVRQRMAFLLLAAPRPRPRPPPSRPAPLIPPIAGHRSANHSLLRLNPIKQKKEQTCSILLKSTHTHKLTHDAL